MKTNVSASRCFIKAALLFSLVFLMSNLFLAQGNNIHTFATSQTNAVSALCLGCSIQNPQNAVGNDPTNYSSLKMGIGLLGKVEQTLIFPTASLQKLAIHIGTGNGELTAALLSAATIETMNGNVSNGDSRIIDSQILTINTWPDNNGLIQFRPTKPYDRVKISLNAGVLSLNRELRIYEAKQSAFVIPCATLPADPFLYYAFNGNLEESINPNSLKTLSSNRPPTFQDSLVCKKALTTDIVGNELQDQYPHINYNQLFPEKTISFWASTRNYLRVTVGETKIMVYDTLTITQPGTNDKLVKIFAPDFFIPLHHYTVTVIPKAPSPAEIALCEQTPSNDYCSQAIGSTISLYIDGDLASSKTFLGRIPNLNFSIASGLFGSKIDELLVYNEALPATVIKELACSYHILQNCSPGSPTPSVSVLKATPTEELFTVSPNPTTGQITLDGNILLLNADISIRNTSGLEVFQSKLTSKTFNLPPTLPEGMYILTLQTKDKKVYSRKIILTR